MARLLEQGSALAGGAVAEFPSVTLCNHTSALTGVGPGRHGVIGNVFHDRETGRRVVPNDATTWHRSAEWLRPGVATVFEQLTAARPQARAGCINEAVDRGAEHSTMQLIRARSGSAAALDGELPPAERSGFLGEPANLDDAYYRWATRVDDAGLAQVLQLWTSAATAPALTWWSNVVTDAGHHAGGPRSAIARDSLRDADRRLQALLAHLDTLGVTGDLTFLLTADHGFESADPAVTGSWAPGLHAALDPLGVLWRDEGPGFVYLGLPGGRPAAGRPAAGLARGDQTSGSVTSPGSHSCSTSRTGTSPSIWHSTPIPPIQTRWISRYSGGRLSFSPTVHAAAAGR